MTTKTEIRLIPDIIKPKPKQRQFIDAVWDGVQSGDPEYILFGGAAGGGKSYSIRWGAVVLAIRLFQTYGLVGVRQGIFCETYATLEDRQLNRVQAEFPSWLGEYNAQRHTFTLTDALGGGVLSFRNLDDPSKYDSAEFAIIWVDELTKNPKETFHRLRTRKRWVGVPHSPFVGATNPTGPGLAWVRKFWLEHDFSGDEDQPLASRPFFFLPALPADNDSLPASYYETLQSLPPMLRKALLEGDWYIFQGQAMPEFQAVKEGQPYHVIPTFPVPAQWRKRAGHDWGRTAWNYTCWGARDPQGGMVIYWEYQTRGLDDEEVAFQLIAQEAGHKVDVMRADPGIFGKETVAYITQRQMTALGKEGLLQMTVATRYREAGYHTPIQPADNRRLEGKRALHLALKERSDGVPYLRIMECCPILIRTLQNIQIDPNRPEDVISEYGLDEDIQDHPYDALRYLLMGEGSFAAPPRVSRPPTPYRVRN